MDKIISIVNSFEVKNEFSLINREELEENVKDFNAFVQFMEEQVMKYEFPWPDEDDYIESISESEEYSEEDIQTYDDIKHLILKAFDENASFVVEEDTEGGAVFFTFVENPVVR